MRDEKGRFIKGHPKPENAHVWGKKEKHPNWKGGIKINHNGYILKTCPTHPDCDEQGYVFEHRLVMENHIGRTLKDSEVVHHINSIKEDNRIENLMLFASHSEHMKHECIQRKRNIKGRFKKGKNE